eukprot:GFUD01007362.1.p1 GENE.GFUD01007362.1~~GFUD01007362.1.p1  ORF type:complete len:318 (+),score=85.68 GFUD01007362.1:58-1011(+)
MSEEITHRGLAMESEDKYIIKDGSPGREESEMVSHLEESKACEKSQTITESTEQTRKGSTCKQIRPLPTFVKAEIQNLDNGTNKMYIKKENLTDRELEHNRTLFEETMGTKFPDEDMKDKQFRDKDKEYAVKVWILKVLDENEENSLSSKKKEKNIQELEDLNFLLKSGIVLCKLAQKIVPGTAIEVGKLEAGNLSAKRKNISLFLKAASTYGVPENFLFKPDDLAVQTHFYKVIRALFALAERTKIDPNYKRPAFEFDKIQKERVSQNIKRKASTEENLQTSSLNSIFANLMQDVERKASLTTKGPPSNIYSCNKM